MNSLKPSTIAATGIFQSCEAWANYAIGADKVSGSEGFERFYSGDWYHPTHYKLISRSNPEYSPNTALTEMSIIRESCVNDIIRAAKEVDEKLMRLQRMEEQMKLVAEQ